MKTGTGISRSGPASGHLARGARVLLVEDETFVGLDLRQGLEKLGFTAVGPVASLDQALVLAQSERIDAAILDIDLGGDDVFPAASVLSSRGIPFVFHTGHGSKRETADAFPKAPVVSKPARAELLIAALEDSLAV